MKEGSPQNMGCLSPRDFLAAWDGLLSEAEQQGLAAHVLQCPRCRELEKTLRELVRLATAATPTAPLAAPGSCPAETELLDYVSQQVTGTRRNQMEAHLTGCRQCLWQVAALARTQLEALPPISPEWRDAVRQAEALVAESPGTSSVRWRLIPAWRYALAAAAAVVLLAIGLFWNEGRNTSPPAPGQAQAPVVQPSATPAPAAPTSEEPALLAQQTQPSRPGPTPQPETQLRNATRATPYSLRVLWPQEGEQVARQELEIQWQAVPGAHLYEVTILNHRGDVVWEAQTQTTRIRVPDDVKMQPGERHFVWVQAREPGQGPARSPSVAFEIRASAPR